MKKSKKLYIGSISLGLISILISLAHISAPLNINFVNFPNLDLFLLLAATAIFLIGILCIPFGRSAEKSEYWFHKVSVVFSDYEKSEAKVS